MANLKSNRQKNTITGLCCSAHFVQDGLSSTIYVLLPILAQAFGLSYAQVGLIKAAHTSSMMILELPSGILSEKFGIRSLLAFGLACAGLGFVYLSYANSIGIIALSLVLAGIGAAFQHAIASSLISSTHSSRGRRSALGIYNSSGDGGKLAFTGLFGLALGFGLSWQNIVAGYGLIAILTGGVIFIVLRKFSAGNPPENRSSVEPKAVSIWMDWGISNRSAFSALIAAIFLDTAVQSGFFIFVTFLVAERNVPTNLAVLAIVATLAGGMFGKAGCGYLAASLGVKYAFALVQCATAAVICIILVTPPQVIFLLLPVLGVFLQGSTSITYGAVNDYVREERKSRGFALIYSLTGLSAIAGPVGFGLIGDYFGLDITMLAMAAVSLLAIVPCIWLHSGEPQTDLELN